MLGKSAFTALLVVLALSVGSPRPAAAHERHHCSRFTGPYLIAPPIVRSSYYPATYYYGYPAYYYSTYPAFGLPYGYGTYYRGSGLYFSVGY